MPPADYYYKKLYPLQDKMLKLITGLNTPFYLSGGTALSCGYLHHRFSDDLDFFVNDDGKFRLWSDRFLVTLTKLEHTDVNVILKEERFIRLFIKQNELELKIEMINDIPSHIGIIHNHDILGHIDSPENVLANKVTAIMDRREPKDYADIWAICTKMNLSLQQALQDAHSKAAGFFAPDLARVLLMADPSVFMAINWETAPTEEQFIKDIHQLGNDLIVHP